MMVSPDTHGASLLAAPPRTCDVQPAASMQLGPDTIARVPIR